MEILAKDLHKFPMTITKLLREIRHLDKLSVLSMNEIKLEEERLLDDFLHYNNFLAQKKREQQVIVQQQKEQERAVALAAAAAMAVASTTEGQEEAVPQQSEQDVPSSSSSNNMPEAEATQTLTPSRVSPSKVLSPKAAPRSPSLASTSATTTAATPNKTDATINVSLTIDVDTTTIAEIVASASSPTANEDPLAPFIARWEAINHKRQKIMKQLEKHVQTTQRIYNLVDTNITTLDTATKPIHHLFPFPDEANAKKNKKKRKKQDEGEHVVDGAPYIDPNEPVYCYCKQISFGAMVACENQDCPIEWFHFPCVNLIEAPTDPWYCPQCAPQFAAK